MRGTFGTDPDQKGWFQVYSTKALGIIRARFESRLPGQIPEPLVPLPALESLRTALSDQSVFIFVRGGKHAGKAAARGGSLGFESHQYGLRISTTIGIHGSDDMERMVNGGLLSALAADQASFGLARAPSAMPALLRRQCSSDSGSSSAASTLLRPVRLAW